MEKNIRDNVNEILNKEYIINLQNENKLLCDVCNNFKFNMYWDRKEKIQICLGCIKNLTQ